MLFFSRTGLSAFFTLFNKWWTIVKCKSCFCSPDLTNAIAAGGGKVDFLISLASWLKNYCDSRFGLCLSKQTFDALITTLHMHKLI